MNDTVCSGENYLNVSILDSRNLSMVNLEYICPALTQPANQTLYALQNFCVKKQK